MTKLFIENLDIENPVTVRIFRVSGRGVDSFPPSFTNTDPLGGSSGISLLPGEPKEPTCDGVISPVGAIDFSTTGTTIVTH